MANRFLDSGDTTTTTGGGNRFLGGTPAKTDKKKKGKSLGDKAQAVGGGALKLATAPLNALQQATFRLGSGIGEAIEGRPGEAIKEVGRGLKELGTAGLLQDDISFEEATVDAKDREAFRRGEIQSNLANVVGADKAKYVGLGADIFLDPLFPTAFSKAKNIKQATKLAETVLKGSKAGERFAEGGVKALGVADKAKLEAGIASKAVETGATGGRRTLAEIAQGVKAPSKMTLEEGAERLVGKTMKGLEQAEKAKPVTAIGRGAEALGAKTGAKGKAAMEAFRSTEFGAAVDDALRPRAGIIRNWGKELADKFKAEGDIRLARFGKRSGDILTEVNARVSQIVKTGGKITAEENKLLGAALRGEQWAVDTIKGTRLADVYDYAAKLEGKTDVAKGAVKAAAAPAKAAAEAVPEGGSELNQLVEMLKARGLNVPESVAKRAGVEASQGTAKVTASGVKPAGVTGKPSKLKRAIDDIPIGDENPLKDVLNRHFEMIHAEETGASLSRMATQITDPETGEALLKAVGRTDDVPEGWVRLKSKHWEGHAAPKEIAQEIDRVGAVIDNGSALRAMGRFADRYDRFWKTSATSLPVGFAFTLRNARSNLFLNWLDGIYTMGPYKEAFSIQRKVGQVMRGEKYAAEIKATSADAVLKSVLTDRQYRIYRLAQEHRVTGANWFDIDASLRGTGHVRSIKGIQGPDSKLGKVKAAGGRAADRGRQMNSAVEDNARLANFIHNLDRTGDAKIAASHTHKYLFDYGDLTEVEQQAIKKWIPFYTFMRKNTPLQVASALKMPGKVGTRLKIGEAVSEPLDPNDPSYLQRSGAVQVPGLAGALGAVGRVAFTPETPLTAAAQTISPFAKLAQAAPAIATGDEETLKELPAEVWRPLMSMLGGARGTPFKLLSGESGQRDPFSGAELAPEDLRMRAAQAFLPAIGRALSTMPNEVKADTIAALTSRDTKEEDKEAIRTWLLRQAGIKVRELK